MKKLMLSMVIVMAVGMGGCAKETTVKTDSKPIIKQEVKEEKKQLMDIEEMGKGIILLETPSGDSSNGNVPFFFAVEDTLIMQIGYTGTDIAGDKITYAYIDGKLNSKNQMSEQCGGSIDLSEKALNVGVHIVEFIQYDTNKEDGKVVVYKVAKYEFKQQ